MKTFPLSKYASYEKLLEAKVEYLEGLLVSAKDVIEANTIPHGWGRPSWVETKERHPNLASYYGWSVE